MTHIFSVERARALLLAACCASLPACLAQTPTFDEPGADAGAGGAGGGVGGASSQGGDPLTTLPACVPDGQVAPPHPDILGAVYSVPVPPELEPYASYPLEGVSLCRLDGGLELGYSLPALLLGKKTRVSFQGGLNAATGTYELSGADGTASCSIAEGQWICHEAFVGLVVDLAEVAKETEGLDPVEAEARLKVAELFSIDPIGILDFSLP